MERNGFVVMGKLIGFVKPLTGYMILAILMGVIGNLCASFITIFGGYAVVKFLGFDIPLSITMIFTSLIIFAIARGILRYAEQASNHFIAFKLLALIRDKIFAALRKLAPAKLEGRNKGDLISVITSDIELLEVFYAHTISPVVIATIFSIIMCVLIGSYHWILGLAAAISYLTVGVIIPIIISSKSGTKGLTFRNKSGELSGFVLDSLRGLNETLQYEDGENRMKEMTEKSLDLANDDEYLKKKAGEGSAAVGSILMIFDFIMLFLSSFLYTKGQIGFDGVLIPTIALMSSFGPTVSLANLGSTLQYTFAAGNRVLDLLEETPVAQDIEGQADIKFNGAAAENITFSYEDQKIIKDLSIEIPKDKIIGIVGRSGCGKSTLLKLFMRFWETDKGRISISNHNVNDINTSNLRDTESFMTQDTQLFKDTILNNILIAKQDATLEEVQNACKKASIHDFIMTLPNGYNTNVGELGDTLSGGERQRLGLARAFLHDAPFMLLDEPTSNLDSLNEAVILKSLHNSHDEKTVILVSHRKSTMGIADKVYSIENGRLS